MLDDRDVRVRRIGGFVFRTRGHRNFGSVRVGRSALRRGNVGHRAREHISLGHRMDCLEVFRRAGRQALDNLLAEVVGVGVGNLHVANSEVTVIHNMDAVNDLFAELVGLAVFRRARGGFNHSDVARRRTREVGGSARRNVECTAAVGGARCGSVVVHVTSKHVCLSHRVHVVHRSRCARSQRPNVGILALSELDASKPVAYHNVVRGKVAVVGHRNGVFDCLAQLVRATVCGRARGRFYDAQVRVELSNVNLVGILVALAVAERDSRGIHERASQQVGFSDGVSRMRLD